MNVALEVTDVSMKMKTIIKTFVIIIPSNSSRHNRGRRMISTQKYARGVDRIEKYSFFFLFVFVYVCLKCSIRQNLAGIGNWTLSFTFTRAPSPHIPFRNIFLQLFNFMEFLH